MTLLLLLVQTFREVGEHGFDFENTMWRMALQDCVEKGKRGALIALFGDEYGGATQFVTEEGHAMLSVLVNGKKRAFLKNVEPQLKWTDEGFMGEGDKRGPKFVFGERVEESVEEQEMRERQEQETVAKGKGKEAGPEGDVGGEASGKLEEDEGGDDDTPLKSSQPKEGEVFGAEEAFTDPVARRTRAKVKL